MKPLSMRKFGQIVARVMETLPEKFQPFLDNLTVDVEEAPSRSLLIEQGFTEEEIAQGDSLFGIFMPLPLPSLWGEDAVGRHDLPHRIVIFKQPLEEEFPDRRQLMIEIRKTVIHELAHHFGFDERDLERFDAKVDPWGEELA